MTILSGLTAPEGEGYVIELHVDVHAATPEFIAWLLVHGFAADPFSVFYPCGYESHYTGRARVSQKKLSAFMPKVRGLMEAMIAEAQAMGSEMYVEVEIVRNKTYFTDAFAFTNPFASLTFTDTGIRGGAKADVHIEFLKGTVSNEVRDYLLRHKFYWVETPKTNLFDGEEIATLQTQEYGQAKKVYEAFVVAPLSACTGIHLEQKLHMLASHRELLMPEVITVT